MSQASTTMAMTTTPLLTIVYSGTSSLLSSGTMAPSLMGLKVTSGQHDVLLPEGGVIPVSEECELLLKAQDILDNAVSKLLGSYFSTRV